jgi:hypothetical protein
MEPILSFVAMFDFLGFKALRDKRGTAGLYKLYMRGLLPHVQHSAAMRGRTIKREGQALYVPDPGPYSVDYRVVSDSILLFVYGNTFDHFFKILSASHNLLCGGLVGHKAPLRGAIGYGDLIVDRDSIWIGSAIEDAYVGESKQVWSGCALTINCADYLKRQGYLELYQSVLSSFAEKESDRQALKNIEKAKRRIVKYAIPEQTNPKTGPIEYTTRDGYTLDWTLNVFEGAGQKGFSKTTDPHALRIIENTSRFEEWARQHNR